MITRLQATWRFSVHIEKVQNRYYLPNMRNEIKEYCKACVKCAETSKRTTHSDPLKPLEIADAPFSVIAIDFLGPFNPASRKGNSNIMVVADYLTKWFEAIPLPDQTAFTTSKALIKHIVSRHGLPKAILTDKGSNFTSILFTEICKELGIDRKLTTAYHTQTDSQTERYNRTLLGMLRCYVEKTRWLGKGIGISEFCIPLFNPSIYESRIKMKNQYGKRAKVPNYQIGDQGLLDIKVISADQKN